MNRSSSRKDLRAERLANTPYSRTPLRQSTSWNPLQSLRNFAQSFVGRNDEDQSVSGSEDDWNGTGPVAMRGQDVYSLADAAGRSGADFDERAHNWREAKAHLRDKPTPKEDWGALGLSRAEKQLRPTPSMPALRGIESDKLAPPPRKLRPSASSMALRQFMENKGVHFEPEDVQMLEDLTRSLRSDPAAVPESRPQKLGGWSAGTPVKSQPLPKVHEAPSTPGSVFSLGSTAPLPPRAAAPPKKITYLGPGMSARRLNREPKAPRRSILDNLDGKRRKVDDNIDVDEVPATPEVAAAACVAAAFNAKRKVSLARSTSTTLPPIKEPSPKKRGDDVLRDLIDETLGPEVTKPSLVINPYEALAPASSGKVPALRSSLRQSSSSLKVSMRGSASRGAAEKLANVGTSTRKLSTLEMVSSYKSTREQPASKSPEPIIPNPGAALKASTSVAPPKTAPKPASKLPEESNFAPLPIPSLSSSTIKAPPKRKSVEDVPIPSAVAEITAPKATPAPVFTPPALGLGLPPAVLPSSLPSARNASTNRVDPSAIYLSAKDSALSVDKVALPFFTFTLPVGSPEPSAAVKDATCARPPEVYNFTMRNASLPSSFLPPVIQADKPKTAQWTCDTCMLTNPDTVKDKCQICEAPRPGAAPAKAAPKAAAPPAPPAGGFSFGASAATSGFTIPKPAKAAGSWDCDTCMLSNPDSAKEKCTVCEAPRPGAAPAKAAAPKVAAPPAPPAGGFSFGAAPAATSGFTIPKPTKAAGSWDCDTCMLSNPGSATEKCTVCEAPKPGAKPAPKAPVAAMPAPPSGGFSFGGKPAAAAPPAAMTGGFSFGKPAATASAAASTSTGGFTFKPAAPAAGSWTCDTCMLSNPSTATDKCTVCETPKPGAKAAAPAAPAAMPAPPSGGFSFGAAAKPAAAAPAPPAGGFSFGAKPAAAGSWTCDTCMLSNPSTATEKCTVCEAPKPGAAPAAKACASLPAPPAGGFSFGGAKAGPPAPPAGGFSFGGKPVVASSSSAAPIAGLPAPPTGGFTFGKPAGAPAAAPLLKPTGGAGEWTCSTCMLSNPASATEKCTVCEEPRKK